MADVPYEIGVHQAHCCLRHGCKYPHKYESCPVGTEKVVQSHPCEQCLPIEEAEEAVLEAVRELAWSKRIWIDK